MMKDNNISNSDLIYDRYPSLLPCQRDIEQALILLKNCFDRGGKLMICGNGGSCADCLHIVGELQKGFLRKRAIEGWDSQFKTIADGNILKSKLQQGLPAISLVSEVALSTAISNDTGAEFCFAQQVWALGTTDDILLCISTSGNSKNVLYAAETAKVKGVKVISLIGDNKLAKILKYSDVTISVPELETYKIQELHLPVYHYLCSSLESYYFK